jgi:mannose/cellobiose epimerase-like protein (N-acyl-D-glucosamine 2-epimerase family)
MIYKFKTAAAGDLILLGPQGDQLMRLLGREPAAQGVIEVDAMPAALQALQAAIATAEVPGGAADSPAADDTGRPAVSLRQRLWPVMELLRAAHAAQARVVWGV